MTNVANVTSLPPTISTNDPLFQVLIAFATVGVIVTGFIIAKTWWHTADRLNDMEYDIRRLKEKIEELGK